MSTSNTSKKTVSVTTTIAQTYDVTIPIRNLEDEVKKLKNYKKTTQSLFAEVEQEVNLLKKNAERLVIAYLLGITKQINAMKDFCYEFSAALAINDGEMCFYIKNGESFLRIAYNKSGWADVWKITKDGFKSTVGVAIDKNQEVYSRYFDFLIKNWEALKGTIDIRINDVLQREQRAQEVKINKAKENLRFYSEFKV